MRSPMEQKLNDDDDDEIEVIKERLNNKRPLELSNNQIVDSIQSKKMCLDTKKQTVVVDNSIPKREPGVPCTFIKKELISRLTIVLSRGNDCPNMKKCTRIDTILTKLKDTQNQLKKKMANIDSSTKKIGSLLGLPSKYGSNNLLHKLPNGMSINPRLSTSPRGPLSLGQTGVDGLQIVNMIVGKAERNLPPPGVIKRSEVTVGARVYAMKTDLYGVWYKAEVISIKESASEKLYKVKFEPYSKSAMIKYCTSKQIAYEKPSDVRLPFGKRIIASYRPEDTYVKPAMYAGIIAEPPKSTNKFRYLVFFDDGYAQYIAHNEICLVVEESKSVWEDIHSETREFIKSYYQQFPERPMLKLQKNQVIKTEYNSRWWFAKVVDVDASMVKMYFEAEKRFEWIYRGSTRLAPLYNELEKAKHIRMSGTGKVRRHNFTSRKAKDQPYVEYTVDEICIDSDSDGEKKSEKPVRRNVAYKSTSQAKRHRDDDDDDDAYKSRLSDVRNEEGEIYFVSLPHTPRFSFMKHTCGPSCRRNNDPEKHRGENPFRIPLLMGWERQVKKFRLRGYHCVIHYRTPCGRTLRNIEEVYRYLFVTKSKIPIDFFTFNTSVTPLQSFRTLPEETLWHTDDITEGKENVAIPCANCLTNEKPLRVEYATRRFPGKNVNLNLDEEFLCGCDCTDDCADQTKCQCQQLTIKAYSKDGDVLGIGYEFRRLTDPVVTGIYECNSRCKCSKSCMNRVVQNGLQIRLQMFKTARKGWGIRCLDDVDAGQFLCIYAGQLLTEQSADEDGYQFGDEYMAELDHIEVAEQTKDGYESDVDIDITTVDVEMKEETDSKDAESEDEDDEESDCSIPSNSSKSSGDSDPEYEGSLSQVSSFSSSSIYATRSRNKKETKKKKFSVFPESDFALDSDESASNSQAKNLAPTEGEKKELPDLNPPVVTTFNPILPRPLSPTTAEELDKMEVGRKPKLDPDAGDMAEKKVKLHGISSKKSLNTMQPLPPPTLPVNKKNIHVSLRTYFGEDSCYIMDAKSKGNIGRYLNHSCYPNSFVQNVFVDTHDLRFPTVAFFAADHIKAGTELTWDYNYDIGSVEGKVLICYCESHNCRRRLL